jgi:hypothetical protein
VQGSQAKAQLFPSTRIDLIAPPPNAFSLLGQSVSNVLQHVVFENQ